jgi:SOS response regulatory protein OraA/RecX
LQLPESAIRDALEEIDEEVYIRNLRSLVEQRKKDNEEKRLRFLLQRGFCFEEIKKCK